MTELGEGYKGRRYWLTGKQLAKISIFIRRVDLPFFDGFEVCDLLKLIEYDRQMEEE